MCVCVCMCMCVCMCVDVLDVSLFGQYIWNYHSGGLCVCACGVCVCVCVCMHMVYVWYDWTDMKYRWTHTASDCCLHFTFLESGNKNKKRGEKSFFSTEASSTQYNGQPWWKNNNPLLRALTQETTPLSASNFQGLPVWSLCTLRYMLLIQLTRQLRLLFFSFLFDSVFSAAQFKPWIRDGGLGQCFSLKKI